MEKVEETRKGISAETPYEDTGERKTDQSKRVDEDSLKKDQDPYPNG